MLTLTGRAAEVAAKGSRREVEPRSRVVDEGDAPSEVREAVWIRGPEGAEPDVARVPSAHRATDVRAKQQAVRPTRRHRVAWIDELA